MNWNKILANIVIQLFVLLPIEVSLSLAAPVISDIRITPISNTQIEVNFTTDEESDTRVNIGLDANLGMFEISRNLVLNHSMIVGSLPDTLYYLKAGAQNGNGELSESEIQEVTTFKTNRILWVNLTGLKDEPIDAVAVEWETIEDSDSVLYYGNASDNLDRFLTGPDNVKMHSVTLSGLVAGEDYYYKVKSSYVQSSVYDFTAPVDITPPQVTYTKPSAFTTNRTIRISGTISENATIEIRSNVYPMTILESGTEQYSVRQGDFNATVQIYEGRNRIEFSAKDAYDNYFTDMFNVTVDSRPPQITLLNFSLYAPFDQHNLTVQIDEDAKINIRLNNASVLSTTDYVDSLNTTLRITQDNNILEVIAEDQAGNTANISMSITKIGEPFFAFTRPNLTDRDVVTRTGNFYDFVSESKDLRITGKTSPNTRVMAWRTIDVDGRPPDNVVNISPDYTTTSGADGSFTLEIPVAEIVTADHYDKYEKVYYKDRGGGSYSALAGSLEFNPQIKNFIRIEALDNYGRKNKEGPINFRVTAGKEGSMYPWTVFPYPDTHAFKPNRLRDGTEMLTFKLKLDWIGIGDEPEIDRVAIVPQRRTLEMLEGSDKELYDCFTEGEIFPNRPKVSMSDDNNTYWYISFKLNPWKGLNTTKVDEWQELWESLVNHKCRLPLKAEIAYTYRDINGSRTPKLTQEWYFRQENMILDELDPKSVFPPWLLDTGLDIIEGTLKVIDPIVTVLEEVNDILRYSCYTMLISYTIKRIKTTVKCGRVSAKTADDKEVLDEKDAEKCAEDIQELKILYNKYRLACDRVWCHAVPRDPAKDKKNVVEGRAITSDGKGPVNGDCDADPNFICITGDPQKKTAMYKLQCGDEYPYNWASYVKKGNCYPPNTNPDPANSESYTMCCKRKEKGIVSETDKIKDETVVFQQTSIWWKGIDSLTKFYIFGRTQTSVSEEDNNRKWNFGAWTGYGAETAKDLILSSYVGAGGLLRAQEVQKSIKDMLKGKDDNGQSYNTYVSGIYGPMCFNQKPWSADRLYMSPSQNFFDSVQCACVKDIYGRVEQVQNVLKYLKQCMEQIKATGEADAGACKQMFTMYVCDLLTWILVKATVALKRRGEVGVETVDNQLPYGSGITMGLQSALDSFTSDYGGNMRAGMDFSMEYLTHSICLASFGNEWDPSLKAMFGATQEGPPRESFAVIMPARRELIGANPIKGTATYEYTVGVTLSAGSKISEYAVELICDQDEDCTGQTQVLSFRSAPEIPSGKVQNVAINEVDSVGGSMIVEDRQFRYNKVRVRWISADGRQYDGDKTVNIEAVEDISLFDCTVNPGAGLGGNALMSCGFLQTNTFAEFLTPPPPMHTITVTSDYAIVKIPFTVKAQYELPEDEMNPFLLAVDEVTKDGIIVHQGDTVEIGQGIFTNEQIRNTLTERYNNLFGTAGASVTAQRIPTQEVSDPNCIFNPASITTATKGGIIKVIFPEGSMGAGSDYNREIAKKTWIDDAGEYRLYTTECTGTPPADIKRQCCSLPNCYYENGQLVLNIEGESIRISPQDKARCDFTISPGAGLGLTQQIKYYRIGLYQNNNGERGAAVKRAGKSQIYDVQVTFNKGTLGQEGAQTNTAGVQINVVPEITGMDLTTTIKVTGTMIAGTQQQNRFNYVSYRLESVNGKTLDQFVYQEELRSNFERTTELKTIEESYRGELRIIVSAGTDTPGVTRKVDTLTRTVYVPSTAAPQEVLTECERNLGGVCSDKQCGSEANTLAPPGQSCPTYQFCCKSCVQQGGQCISSCATGNILGDGITKGWFECTNDEFCCKVTTGAPAGTT